MVIRVAALLAFLAITSCGTFKMYSGPTLPDDQVGFLQVKYIWNNVWVRNVDNDNKYSGGNFSIPRWVALLPGRHTVEVFLSGDTPGGGWMQSGNVTREFWIKPGHKYRIVRNITQGSSFPLNTPPGGVKKYQFTWDPYIEEIKN